jgi:hypothetical protein
MTERIGPLVGDRKRRMVALTVAAASLLVAAVSVTLAAQATATADGTHARPGPIRFSHAVIVDEQKPGFEPDVKVDGKGVIYTSVPNGFSTTISYLWFSHDHGNSYLPIPGTVALGKPATCVGGGDSDLFLDSHNALYFSDLQGLTNISNSVSQDGGKTWTTNCAGAPNTPDDRMWFAGTGSLAKHNLLLYQDYDVAAGSLPSQNNALVETESTDGVHFVPVVNTAPSSDCVGPAIHDCVTGNEGISGNQVVDPKSGSVFIAHTSVEGTTSAAGVRVSEGKIKQGAPPSASWSESPNLDGALCPGSTKSSDGSRTCIDKNGNPEEIAGENFATIARDSAGYLYVTFTAGPIDHKSSSDPNFGGSTAAEQIYVVHSLSPAGSSFKHLKWSAPQRITGGRGLSQGTNTFPWITAGSNGRVAVAWYHTNEVKQKGTCASGSGTCTLYGASSLTKAQWTVQMGESLNAHSAHPKYRTAKVSEGPIKSGQLCTNGIGCLTGGDRSLGDFLEISPDPTGAAVVSFVYDTTQDSSDGEEAGPEAISRQISGPSLFASVGRVKQGRGPGRATGHVKDPAKDDFYSAGGTLTPGGSNLDLTGASLANGRHRTLVARIRVRSLKSLTPSSSAGGADASWILRWTVVHRGKTSGGDQLNGHVYYVGMDDNAGAGGPGTPSFFAGDTSAIPPPGNTADHTKYFTFPQSRLLSKKQAAYNKKTGVITFRVPLKDVGNPRNGTRLYSATAFTSTASSPQSANTLFNQIDATPPFELVIARPRTRHRHKRGGSIHHSRISRRPNRARGFTG